MHSEEGRACCVRKTILDHFVQLEVLQELLFPLGNHDGWFQDWQYVDQQAATYVYELDVVELFNIEQKEEEFKETRRRGEAAVAAAVAEVDRRRKM